MQGHFLILSPWPAALCLWISWNSVLTCDDPTSWAAFWDRESLELWALCYCDPESCQEGLTWDSLATRAIMWCPLQQEHQKMPVTAESSSTTASRNLLTFCCPVRSPVLYRPSTTAVWERPGIRQKEPLPVGQVCVAPSTLSTVPAAPGRPGSLRARQRAGLFQQ